MNLMLDQLSFSSVVEPHSLMFHRKLIGVSFRIFFSYSSFVVMI